jgi:hypothetical protein
MAATTIADIIVQVRAFLVETTARFWSDAELTSIFTLGVNDLWGAILDVHGEHYMTVDATNVSVAANAASLSGVPADCFRVLLIEARDTTTSPGRDVLFVPKKYNHPDFRAARSQTASTAANAGVILYHVSGVGAPISAPVIYTAPMLSETLLLRLAYCPTITVSTSNPIPGQSDNALKAWTLAYALGKEQGQGQRVPDPGWLSVYSTEKQLILVRLTPRQEQEPEVVDSFLF